MVVSNDLRYGRGMAAKGHRYYSMAEDLCTVDVFLELAKMESWLDANPAKRKTKKGIKRFVNSWLSRAQDQGGSSPIKIDGPKTIRQRSNLDDLTDISWLEGSAKEHMRVYFTNKYGQAFDG
jgi:hypothetical protein